jgi:hypothetical protein
MISNIKIVNKFENRLIAREKVNIKRNCRIFEGLYKEAVALGVFPLKDPLEGLDAKAKFVRKLNRVSKTA